MWDSKQATVRFCVHGDPLVWRNVKRGTSDPWGTGDWRLVSNLFPSDIPNMPDVQTHT